MISIDGSYGEGGGQIIRTAVALSAITGKQIEIENIRASRPNPGLQPQHLTAVNALAKMCTADVDAKLGATALTFKPHKLKGGHFTFDIGTAGSVSLVLQTLLLPALHAERDTVLEIAGGTHVTWSPTVDYMDKVFGFYMGVMGVDFSLSTEKYGFYPAGGGKIKATLRPSAPKPINLVKREGNEKIKIISVASEDLKKSQVAERQAGGTRLGGDTEIKYVSSKSTGSALLAIAKYNNCALGFSSLGDRGKKAEDVGMEAAIGLKKQIVSNACVDENMADQLLPFLAFAKGTSKMTVSEVSEHVKTNIWVIEQFLPVRFEISGKTITVSA